MALWQEKSSKKSDSQDDCPAVGQGHHSSVPICTVDQCECIAHALQAVTELDPETTITTMDGISAFHSIPRRALLLGLDRVAGGRQALPCALVLFRTLRLSLGGRRGDRPHDSSRRGTGGPLDATPVLLGAACRGGCVPQRGSWRIFTRQDPSAWWQNPHLEQGRDETPVCDILQRQAEETDPDARVWRGSEVSTTEQGIKVLGTPLGHEDFVNQHESELLVESGQT